MQVDVVNCGDVAFDAGESCLVVPLYAGELPLNSEVLKEEHELVLQALADKEILSGKAQACYYLPTPHGQYGGVLVAGVGPRGQADAEALRRVAGAACGLLTSHRVEHLCVDVSHFPELPVAAFFEGVVLGQYAFELYKSPKGDTPPKITVSHFTAIVGGEADGAAVSELCQAAVLKAVGTNGARRLADTPSNEMTPSALAEFAVGIGENADCTCTVLDQMQMASLGMGALLGVAKGGGEAPKLIVLEYRPKGAKKTLAMAGKGVTFDSGGISIKPGDQMHEMKYDMCGAAAVLCAMLAIVELRPCVNLVAVVPAVENKPDAEAQTPGDIVRAYNGKTIEIHNTDAEGRLILADALAYLVDKYNPDAVIDLATLTGACVVALGHYAAGMLGNDEALMDAVDRAAEASGDRVWRLPLWEDYCKLIEGTHADLCNIGPKGEAGAIMGAALLKEFVGDTPWVHLDIAGTAWGGKHIPYLNEKHATGYGVRLLAEWVLANT